MLSPVQVDGGAHKTPTESESRFTTSVCARESSACVCRLLWCIYCERRKGHFISPSLNVIANYDRVCSTVLLIRPLDASKFSCPLLLFQFGCLAPKFDSACFTAQENLKFWFLELGTGEIVKEYFYTYLHIFHILYLSIINNNTKCVCYSWSWLKIISHWYFKCQLALRGIIINCLYRDLKIYYAHTTKNNRWH